MWGVQRVGTTGREIENYIYDGRGSVSALADQIGNVVTQYRYDPFGVMTKNEATEKSVFGYNGEEYNQAIESQYLRGRYYTPKAGRFSVEDSYQGNIVNPLSLNKYTYGLNNPLRYRDPSGHRAESGMEGAVSKPKTPSPGVTSNKNRQASPSDTVTRTPAGTTTVNKPAPSYPGVTPNKNRQSSPVNEVWVNPGGNYTSSHPVNKAQYGYTGALTNAVWNPPVTPPKPVVTSYDAKSRQASPSDYEGYMALQKEITRVAEEKRKKVCEGLKETSILDQVGGAIKDFGIGLLSEASNSSVAKLLVEWYKTLDPNVDYESMQSGFENFLLDNVDNMTAYYAGSASFNLLEILGGIGGVIAGTGATAAAVVGSGGSVIVLSGGTVLVEGVAVVVGSVVLVGEGVAGLLDNLELMSSSKLGEMSGSKPGEGYNHREKYLNQVDNPKLKNIVNELYRAPATVGDGGTADKLIDEFNKGESLKHLQKAEDSIRNLEDIVKNQDLTSQETKLAYKLLNDLYNAVKYVKR